MSMYLFLDMNSFFASVEQQEQPELRGQPVGVVPVIADTTCCIAASYEAKALGIKTGTGVGEAKKIHPDVKLTLARPKLYVEYHNRIVEAVQTCIPVEKVCSIDEMVARLMTNESGPDDALAIGYNIKQALRRAVGDHVTCSIGIGPSRWSAKVATDLEKPDGLVYLSEHDFPECFFELELDDLPGIGRGMKKRLFAAGIMSVENLAALSQADLRSVWGSRVHGDTWYARLRGEDLPDPPTQRRSYGHSHVLAPEFRTREQAYKVITRMIHKAAFRMRKGGYLARYLHVLIKYRNTRDWYKRFNIHYTRDTETMLWELNYVWSRVPPNSPYHVSVNLTDLCRASDTTLPLFPEQQKWSRLTEAMDLIQDRFGHQMIYAGSMLGSGGAAPTRISFTQIPDVEEFTAEDKAFTKSD